MLWHTWPRSYKRTEIKAQTSGRFEEFDFSYYNHSSFAGLENDIPNSYCNPLLQVRNGCGLWACMCVFWLTQGAGAVKSRHGGQHLSSLANSTDQHNQPEGGQD